MVVGPRLEKLIQKHQRQIVADNTYKARADGLFKVVQVIDGDTIELEDKTVVRYIGVNTPETKDPRKPVECYGQEAYFKNKEWVEGKVVRLEKDVSDKDKYGRWLRYVCLDDKMINEQLVRQGFAQVATYPPDVKYVDRLLSAEEYSEKNNLGLWNKCK